MATDYGEARYIDDSEKVNSDNPIYRSEKFTKYFRQPRDYGTGTERFPW